MIILFKKEKFLREQSFKQENRFSTKLLKATALAFERLAENLLVGGSYLIASVHL